MSTSAKLLRIYTDESAFIGDRKVFEHVAEVARSSHMAGVTVLDARLGFGRSAHVHRKHLLDSDRALVIEIVDMEERLRSFVAELGQLPGVGLITLEAVEVLGGSGDLGETDDD